MLRLRTLAAAAMIALASAPSAAAEPAPPRRAQAASTELEHKLEDAFRALLAFRFFHCDAPAAVARIRAASERFGALHPQIVAAVGRDRAAELAAALTTDPANIYLPGCPPADELEQRVAALERAVERLASALPAAPSEALPAPRSDSLFARLFEASPSRERLLAILSTQTISSATATIGPGNRGVSGDIRLNVAAAEMAAKLDGCPVERWRDVEDGGVQDAFILWACPARRLAGNDCYYYSYRAELRELYPPLGLFIGEWPSWDHDRCGIRIVAPPQP